MTKEEFIKLASDFGYTQEEIKDLIDLQKETQVPFEEIKLIEHIYD